MTTELREHALSFAVDLAGCPNIALGTAEEVVKAADAFYRFLSSANDLPQSANKDHSPTPKGKPAKAATSAPAAEASAPGATEPAAGTAKAPAASKAAGKAEAGKVVTKVEVQQAVVKLVNKFGRESAAKILSPYGAANVSALAPEHYGEVIEAAKAKIAKAAEDAAS